MATMANRKYWPIGQLTLSRLREFLRQPAAVFWVYGFPILMMLSLGMAFREKQNEEYRVDLVEGSGFGVQGSVHTATLSRIQEPENSVMQALAGDSKFKVVTQPAED